MLIKRKKILIKKKKILIFPKQLYNINFLRQVLLLFVLNFSQFKLKEN